MPATSSVKVALFDMDGVLVDVSRSYRRAIVETTEHFIGRPPAEGAIQRFKNGGGFNDDWALTHALVREGGGHASLGRVTVEFNRRYRGENWDGLITTEPPLMTATQMSAFGKAFRMMGVVTGRPRVEAEWTLDRFGWKEHFPLLVSRDDSHGRGKPDPYPIHVAMAQLDAAGIGVQASETVYVGDQGDDMRAARAAGVWAIGFVPSYLGVDHADVLREAGAHAVVTDHASLLDALSRAATRGQPTP